MKEHLSDYKWIYIIVLLFISTIAIYIDYENRYPCVYGHTEQMWQQQYTYSANGTMTPIGGYWADVFVCDCRKGIDTLIK